MDNQSQLLLLLALSVKIFPQPLLAGSQLGVLGFLLSLFFSIFSHHPQPSLPSDRLEPSLPSDHFLLSLLFDYLQFHFLLRDLISVHCLWPRLVLTLNHSDPLRWVLIKTVWVAGIQQLSNHLIHFSVGLGFIDSFIPPLWFLRLLVPQSRILLICFFNFIQLIHLINLINLNFGTQTASENLWVVDQQSDETDGHCDQNHSLEHQNQKVLVKLRNVNKTHGQRQSHCVQSCGLK